MQKVKKKYITLPDKFTIPTHVFARSEGTPALLKIVEEK